MTKRWFRLAHKVPAGAAGVMDHTGHTKKVILHTDGVQRGTHGADGNAIGLAHYVAPRGIAYHLIYDIHGNWAQCYPADVGSRALKASRWSPNRQGDIAIQVCFAGIKSAAELAHWPMKNWGPFLKWAHKWGVPLETHVNWKQPSRSESDWRKSGWVAHSHAPFNDHTDGTGAPIKMLLNVDKQTGHHRHRG